MCKECNEVKHICNGDKMFYNSFDELTDDLKEKYCGLTSGRNYTRAKNGYVVFINELSENKHTLLSNYVTGKTKVLIDYNCGHEPSWITPNNYKKGARCQKCYDERRGLKGEDNPNYGGKCWTDERRRRQSERMKGSKNPSYKSELTDEEREQGRNIPGYDEWKQQVKEQANFTCEICGYRGNKLRSHHLDGYNLCKDRRVDITNGVCLCEHCHKDFHKHYGKGNNTEEQYLEYKFNYKNN